MQPTRPNLYTGSLLDRVSARRAETDWVAGLLADPASRFVPVWRGRALLHEPAPGAPQAVFAHATAAAPALAAGVPWALLGLRPDGSAVFALDLGADEQPILADLPGQFTDLRPAASLLPDDEAAVLAHARGLLHWRARHRFCGVCGTACTPASAGNQMHCPGCGTHHFPRTDPAVIMLVTDGDRALLAHSHRFPTVVTYSTLAGFVEPGESLEEAVAREVMEEVGIQIGNVRYHSSQPWPFPASVMLGFYADALTHTVTIDETELRDARWFTRAALRDPQDFDLPRADSIARRLIEDWIAA